MRAYDAIEAELARGRTLTALAHEHGLLRQTLYNRLRSMGRETRRAPPADGLSDHERGALHLRAAGFTPWQVADRLNTSPGAVLVFVCRARAKLREAIRPRA